MFLCVRNSRVSLQILSDLFRCGCPEQNKVQKVPNAIEWVYISSSLEEQLNYLSIPFVAASEKTKGTRKTRNLSSKISSCLPRNRLPDLMLHTKGWGQPNKIPLLKGITSSLEPQITATSGTRRQRKERREGEDVSSTFFISLSPVCSPSPSLSKGIARGVNNSKGEAPIGKWRRWRAVTTDKLGSRNVGMKVKLWWTEMTSSPFIIDYDYVVFSLWGYNNVKIALKKNFIKRI